ncbi:MAG: hypothetical protein H0T73_13045 [Ardenticatenales bacterium]|nr:hypothetical protein [Ardenticatenales bacterium]
MTDSPDDATRSHLQHTYALFAGIRRRFNGASVKRGGHDRPEATPLYVRRLGVEGARLFGGVDVYAVESAFTEEQESYMMEALAALKNFVSGKEGAAPLAERIVQQYLHHTAPYFVLAMLRSTEDLLRDFVAAHPGEAAILDAIFRVAGGEGFRDLIRIYGARLLEEALANVELTQPDILAFVDVHDSFRKDSSGKTVQAKYEVWCPGRSLARAYLNQCHDAARTLVQVHGVRIAPPKRDEYLIFPHEISAYLNDFAQQLLAPVLERYGID